MTEQGEREWAELGRIVSGPFVMLTTFRRSGVGVPTVVWAADVNGRYFFTTPSTTAKVKRLAHTERVTVGPSDRTKALPGSVIEALARPCDDLALLAEFKHDMRKRSAVMSRVIELRYLVKKDQRCLYELHRPQVGGGSGTVAAQ